MSVRLFFGLPGSGKTTVLTSIALKESNRRRKRYANIFTNVGLAIPGVTYIDNDCIGKYDLSNSLILVDESTLFANCRDYKTFDKNKLAFFVMHRHYNCDIFMFSQEWASMDKRIRAITDRVYYVYKGFWTRSWLTSYYRIPYGIIIPDPKKNGGDKLGEIIQGYCKPNLFVRIFSHKIYRPRYYKYFDSWEAPDLPKLPQRYQPFSLNKDPFSLSSEGT